MTVALLDTSILIAVERGAIGDPSPLDNYSTFAVSAVTIAELNIGVLRSTSTTERQRRLTAFSHITATQVLPFDDTSARTYAELVVWAESYGKRPSVADAMIVATAVTYGYTLVTRDQGIAPLAEFEGLDLHIV